MVRTRRKNYIPLLDPKKTNVPVCLSSKKASTEVSSNMNLLDCSSDILINISSYLSSDSLKNLRLVCRRLNDIGIAALIRRTKAIIKRYREFVKFSPTNMHPDIDACCVLQNLCLLERDMKSYKNSDEIYFPIMIQDEATELLNLMLKRNPENSSQKEERTKNLVQLIYRLRCTKYNSTLTSSAESDSKTKKHKPITFP